MILEVFLPLQSDIPRSDMRGISSGDLFFFLVSLFVLLTQILHFKDVFFLLEDFYLMRMGWSEISL